MILVDVLAVRSVPDDRPIVHPKSIYNSAGRSSERTDCARGLSRRVSFEQLLDVGVLGPARSFCARAALSPLGDRQLTVPAQPGEEGLVRGGSLLDRHLQTGELFAGQAPLDLGRLGRTLHLRFGQVLL